MSHDDFKFEAAPGVPEPLPRGEVLIWQGSPDWWVLATHGFHVRKLIVYFALLLGWQYFNAGAPLTVSAALSEIGFGLSLALFCTAGLMALAWGYSRSTVYSITSRRIIIRSGIALQITVNIPYSLIVAADIKVYSFGTGAGAIPMRLRDGHNVSYVVMWPNVRPWRFFAPQPMFRAIANAETVARILYDAVQVDRGPELSRIEIRPQLPGSSGVSATDAPA